MIGAFPSQLNSTFPAPSTAASTKTKLSTPCVAPV